MKDFEKDYYEAEIFWQGDALQDENNLSRIRETAAMIPADAGSLVDIGCGNGVFVNYLKQILPKLKLLAIDRSQAALKYVTTEKREGDIAAIPLTDRTYDCVTCLEVIEHLPLGIYERALSELARVAKSYVIISVPFAENLEANHTQCPICKSIFNSDLHLRTFSESTISHLLERHGFKCVTFRKAGKQVSYRGHHLYTRVFYPEQFRSWRSPICPICGYREETAHSFDSKNASKAEIISPRPRRLVSYLSAFPKLFWPQEARYYWIIALYQRSDFAAHKS